MTEISPNYIFPDANTIQFPESWERFSRVKRSTTRPHSGLLVGDRIPGLLNEGDAEWGFTGGDVVENPPVIIPSTPGMREAQKGFTLLLPLL
jgi:hypothetical protein